MASKEKKEPIIYVADFETTVLSQDDLKELGMEEQTETEVWSAAIMKSVGPDEIEKEPVYVYNNIFEFMSHLERLEDGSIVYFHNLRFDGSYQLNHIIDVEHWTPCVALDTYDPDDEDSVPAYGSSFDQRFQPYSYKCCISKMNQWYSLTLRFENKTIQIRDSAKLLPLTLREIGKGFQTKFQKLEMKYSGIEHRAFGPITAKELSYIKNDVRVLSEAIWKARNIFGLKKMTIASCALEELKNIITEPVFDYLFPDLREFSAGDMTVFEYIQRSYMGGWCYNDPRGKNKVYATPEGIDKYSNLIRDDVEEVKNIIVLDVNSLYPFSLRSNKGNPHYYPIGEPVYMKGEPSKGEIEDCCIFRRFKCHFDIKPNHLPFIHIRNSNYYKANECLTTDKIMGKKDVLPNGESTIREFIMCQTDYELFCEQYDLTDVEHIDYVMFEKAEGIFDDYIDKWMANKVKGKKTGNKALTLVSKLMLNSLYGRLGTGLDSSSRYCYMEDGVLKFRTHYASDKNPVAMAAASYCTSIARNVTIRAAQANYEHFRYSDTDSIHLVDIDPDEVVGVEMDATKLGAWDCEVSKGAIATYVKQKTYIELSTEESFKPVLDKDGNESYNLIIKAAGLSDNGKEVFRQALLLGPSDKNVDIKVGDDTYKLSKLYINDFKPGFGMEGVNLKAKQIKGGVLLARDNFSLS